MNIALDYDGTCTEDIDLFYMFVKLARASGHKVYIVTMRFPSEINDPKFPGKAIPQKLLDIVNGTVCTSRQAKRKVMDDLNIPIQVWIDDNPLAVEKSAGEIWGWTTPEGIVVDSVAEAEQVCRSLNIPIPEQNG